MCPRPQIKRLSRNRRRRQKSVVEAIFSVLAIRDGVAPPTTNYHTPDPDCDLDYVPNTARKLAIESALSNSFGFGGTNGSLIFRRFKG